MAKEKEQKQEKKEKTKAESPKKDRREEKRGMKVVIRILGTDVDGEKPVKTAILKIKGVSHAFAGAVVKAAKITDEAKLGSFSESEIKNLEEIIKNPKEHGIPNWVLNRRKNAADGKDIHVSSSDVDITKKFDVKRLIDNKSYKGVRHMLGLPVRGQRTRSSFRKGKTVGVVRKAARIQSGAKKK